jgi:hypothetical protein
LAVPFYPAVDEALAKPRDERMPIDPTADEPGGLPMIDPADNWHRYWQWH